ncbi:MAG TPA: HD domain-containing protein [Pyrinomonadaceae bacterium]|nr:HD domain-containing protein [Pyrinomonadaceae bacterium]
MNRNITERVDEILAPFSSDLRSDGYRNHVCRVVSFCEELFWLDEEERHKITIAACFHDLGIYTDDTFDYLPPSIELARSYLVENHLDEWSDEIASMIDDHHRLTAQKGNPLCEVFRKADLIDFSLGIFKKGVSRSKIAEVKSQFPNLGFHRNLARVAGRWICRHPFDPVPVVKW